MFLGKRLASRAARLQESKSPARSRVVVFFRVFFVGNTTLLAVVVAALLTPRWKTIRCPLSPGEFAFYFSLGASLLAISWLVLRRSPPTPSLLFLGQASILLSLLGATVPFAGARLYDACFFGLPFDKLVHWSWAFTGGILASGLVRRYTGDRGSAHALAVIFLVLGVGAYWEIVEYLVSLGVPDAGVGGYDNNMQDMVANLFGACCSLAAPRRWGQLGPPQARED